MRKHIVGSMVLIVLAVTGGLLPSAGDAAERAHPFRIGVLTESWGPQPQTIRLRDGMIEVGYKENEDFIIGVRFTQGDLAALSTAAEALVQYGVDLIYVTQPHPAKAAQQATTTIPIVFAGVGDPLGLGLIQSFARPGGNITGVADLNLALSAKRLQILHEMLPDLKQILFLYDSRDSYAVTEAQAYRDAARRLDIRLVERAVQSQEEVQATLAQIGNMEVGGILPPKHVSLNIPGFVVEASVQQAIPTMYSASFWTERGALASYGPDYYETGRQATRLVDKIIKGANPGDIPVEVNTKVEFTINLKTAKSLGLTMAPDVLYRADRIIR